MKNNYCIEKVAPLTYTDEDWNRYFDFRTKGYALINQQMPFDSLEKLKERVLVTMKSSQEIYKVWKNEQENGIFVFSLEFKDDLKKRYTYLMNDMNDKYLESNLLEMIFKQFLDYDEKSNYLEIDSKDGINDYVIDLYDAQVNSLLAFYELNIQEANVEIIDAWLVEASSRFPNLRIAFYKDIPDNLLEEYAALYRQLWADMPNNTLLDDMTITAEGITAESIKSAQEAGKLNNHCAYRYVIFNEANQLIAKTYVGINLKQPQVIQQLMTGVIEKYRGRGLGKWIKAAMFKKLIADFPELEKIETTASPMNHSSIGLSKQMGYKKAGVQKSLLIDRATIAKHLSISS